MAVGAFKRTKLRLKFTLLLSPNTTVEEGIVTDLGATNLILLKNYATEYRINCIALNVIIRYSL